MSEDKGPLPFLKKLFSSDGKEKQKLTKKHYFIIVLVVGIAFMLMSNFFSKNNHLLSTPVPVATEDDEKMEEVETFGKTSSQPSTMKEYEEHYENQLKEAIETAVGVEDVTIVVNLESTEKKIYEKNTINKKQTTSETDTNGGQREVEDHSIEEQIVIIREGDKEIPLVSETKKPQVRGVLVVAKGADNIQVKKSIIEAVMRVLDVPSHRVSVMAKK